MNIEELAQITKRGFDEMNERFESVDKRFEAIDKRFESVEQRFDKIEATLGDIKSEISDIKSRLTELEQLKGLTSEIDYLMQRVATLEKQLKEHIEKVS